MTIPTRFIGLFTAFAVVFALFGGFFAAVPSAEAHTAILGDFVNNGAAGGNIVGGRTNILAMDITLPAADDDLFLDGDGSDSDAAGAQAAIANGTALIRFVAADNICARDADGGAVEDANAISKMWLDDGANEGNCGVDGGVETIIMGGAPGVGTEVGVGASTLVRLTHNDNVVATGTYSRTGDADATNDEDIYDDVDRSLFYRADALHAVTVQNTAGTAVNATDILNVQLWIENSGDTTFQSGADLNLDANCAWNAGGGSWDCTGANPAVDTLALITGLNPARIYVTIDTALNPTINRTVQMEIPLFADGDVDGRYDANEDGIFFSNAATANASRHDGPPGAALTNANVMTFSSATTTGGTTTTTPPANNPPNAPSGITATAGDGKVDLAWTNTLDADFASAKIYRSEVSGTLGTVIASALTGTTYSDTSVAGGTTYYYTVRSVDKGGNESTNTTQVMATPTAAATTPPAEEQPPAGEEESPPAGMSADGALWQFANDFRIFVLKVFTYTDENNQQQQGAVLRHIVDATVPTFYGHLGANFWSKVFTGVEGTPGTETAPNVSAWVRGSDGKVWEVNGDGTKHWMHMTWDQFVARVSPAVGGAPSEFINNLIFEVNDTEVAHYTTGPDVLP